VFGFVSEVFSRFSALFFALPGAGVFPLCFAPFLALVIFSSLFSAPDARAYFLLLRQKKVAKEKATLVARSATPTALRYSKGRAAG
jgi:hypothetical protein